jgi:hypothetical protein
MKGGLRLLCAYILIYFLLVYVYVGVYMELHTTRVVFGTEVKYSTTPFPCRIRQFKEHSVRVIGIIAYTNKGTSLSNIEDVSGTPLKMYV